MSLLKRLMSEWNTLMIEHHDEILATYNVTVAHGNKETFDEFKERLRMEWFKEMTS